MAADQRPLDFRVGGARYATRAFHTFLVISFFVKDVTARHREVAQNIQATDDPDDKWHSQFPKCVSLWLEPTWDSLTDERKQVYTSLGWDAKSWRDVDVPSNMPEWDGEQGLPEESRTTLICPGDMCDDPETAKVQWNCFVHECQINKILHKSHSNSKDSLILQKMKSFSMDVMPPQGLKKLRVGFFKDESTSWLIATVMGRLMNGVWKIPMQFVELEDEYAGQRMLTHSKIDMIADARTAPGALQAQSEGSAEGSADAPAKAAFRDYGDLEELESDQLFVTIPFKGSKYWDAVGDNDQVFGRFWTDILSPELQDILPHGDCSIGPWENPKHLSDDEVWCATKRKNVPLILAEGPIRPEHPLEELMVFIKTQELPYGIRFLTQERFERRLYIMSRIRRPTLALVRVPSLSASRCRAFMRRVVFPMRMSHQCGHLGTWTDPGNWTCGSMPRRLSMLASVSLPWAVDAFMERFDLSDADIVELLHQYSDSYKRTGDKVTAVTASVEEWVNSHVLLWQPWFKLTQVVDLSQGKEWVFGAAIALLVICFNMETHAKKATTYPDVVDRKQPVNYFSEILAGVMDTINISLRSLGVAAVLCVSNDLKPYQGILFKHILIGHFIAQTTTLVLSNYETPLLSPTIEILPVMKLVEHFVLKNLVGLQSQAVIVTVIAFSTFVSLLSGAVLYIIGRAKLGRILRYMPYVAEISVQAAIGIVLLDLGVEASCDMGVLEIGSMATITEFAEKTILWIPAVGSAAGVFLFTHYIYDSHYTIIFYMVVATMLFHVSRIIMGASCEVAAEVGYLFPKTDSVSVLSLYDMDRTSIYWMAIPENIPAIVVCLMVIVVINCACQLAVAPTLMPPKLNGLSDFDHEMVVQGKAHMLSGLFIGFPSDYGNDDCLVHRMFGGSYRIGVWVHVGTLAVVILVGAIADVTLPYIPKFINACIILLAAIEFILASMVHSRHDLAKSEYYIVCVAALVVVLTGGQMQAGLLVAIFLGGFEFISKYTHVALSVMPRLRTVEGHKVATAHLSGFLFFANTTPVIDELLAWSPSTNDKETCAIVIDWAEVTGLDTKAAHEFHRLAMDCGQKFLFYSRVSPEVAEALRHGDAIAPEPEKEGDEPRHSMDIEMSVVEPRKEDEVKIHVVQEDGSPLVAPKMNQMQTVGQLCIAAEKVLFGAKCKIMRGGALLDNSATLHDVGLTDGAQVKAVIISGTSRKNSTPKAEDRHFIGDDEELKPAFPQKEPIKEDAHDEHGGHAIPARWPVLCEDVTEGIIAAEQQLGEVPELPEDVGPQRINYSAAQRMAGVGRVRKTKARRSSMVTGQGRQVSEGSVEQ